MKMKKLTALLSTAAMMFTLVQPGFAAEPTLKESFIAKAETAGVFKSGNYEKTAEGAIKPVNDVEVPTDIEVSVHDADNYKQQETVTFSNSTKKREFDFKATMFMETVKQKLDDYLKLVEMVAKEDADIMAKVDELDVEGQFIVKVIYPDSAYFVVDADAENDTAMVGFENNESGIVNGIFCETVARDLTDNVLTITVDIKDGVKAKDLTSDASKAFTDLVFGYKGIDVLAKGTYDIEGTVKGYIKVGEKVIAPGETEAKMDPIGEIPFVAVQKEIAGDTSDAGKIQGTVVAKKSSGGGLSGGTVTKKANVTFYNGTEKHLEENVNITSGAYVYDTTAVSVPEADGNKIFTGWYKDKACTEPASAKESITKDTNFYAGWLDTKFDINYNIDGKNVSVNTGVTGSVNVGAEDLVVTETGVEVKLSGIEAVGVKVLGWYLDPEFKTPAGDSYTATEDITFYASTKEIGTPGDLNAEDHFAYIIGYPEGVVKPENFITRQEVATIFFRLLTDEAREANFATTNSFVDVEDGAWSNNAISTMAKMGIVEGYGDNIFKPLNNITRAEFATMAARFTDGEPAESPFTDTVGHWAEDYIGIAASLQWVNGSDGLFRPNDYITRAEVMAIVNRVLKRNVTSEYILEDAVKWSDNPETAWYYEDVIEATNSHTYERVAPGQVAERWLEITATKDWSALEQ